MSMTKKDYELIAGAVHRTVAVTNWFEKNQIKKQAKLEVLRLVAGDLAGTLSGDNPKFDRQKFLQACGINPSATFEEFWANKKQ